MFIYSCSLKRDGPRVAHAYIKTHLPLVPHIYASVNQISIGSDNGLSPIRSHAIIWTIDSLLSIGLLWIHFSDIWIKIVSILFKKMQLKMSSAKLRPFCEEGDELTKLQLHPLDLFKILKIAFDDHELRTYANSWKILTL